MLNSGERSCFNQEVMGGGGDLRFQLQQGHSKIGDSALLPSHPDVSSLQGFNSVTTANHWPTLELPYNGLSVSALLVPVYLLAPISLADST